MKENFKIYCAPLQGYTDFVWRNAHEKCFGGIEAYFSPFIRIEHGSFRNREITDIIPENNTVHNFIPQILACKPQEAICIMEKITSLGYKHVDINLGCPHPPIALHHKGAGLLKHPIELKEFINTLSQWNDVTYSVKMRLGWDDNKQWKAVIPHLDIIKPSHITIHPRIGIQQYKGELDTCQATEFINSCPYPVIYNGEIQSIDDVYKTLDTYPILKGVMMGRAIISHPFITSTDNNTERLIEFHNTLVEQYCNRLTGGEKQILNKLKSLWELFLPDADRKARKAIKKCNKMSQYFEAANVAITSIINKD